MSIFGWICIKLNEYFKSINLLLDIADCDAPDRVKGSPCIKKQ